MSLFNLPNEIIILICEYIEVNDDYYNNKLFRWQEDQYHSLFPIYDLVSSSKRFSFLKNKLFLILIETEHDNIARVVNYMGKKCGPEYWWIGFWSGYRDKNTNIYIKMVWFYEFYKIINDISLEICENIDFYKLCGLVYKNFNDQEIKKFVKGKQKRTLYKNVLIRNKFPLINLNEKQLEKYVNKCKKQIQLFE